MVGLSGAGEGTGRGRAGARDQAAGRKAGDNWHERARMAEYSNVIQERDPAEQLGCRGWWWRGARRRGGGGPRLRRAGEGGDRGGVVGGREGGASVVGDQEGTRRADGGWEATRGAVPEERRILAGKRRTRGAGPAVLRPQEQVGRAGAVRHVVGGSSPEQPCQPAKTGGGGGGWRCSEARGR